MLSIASLRSAALVRRYAETQHFKREKSPVQDTQVLVERTRISTIVPTGSPLCGLVTEDALNLT